MQTIFEKTGGKETATYQECIRFYEHIAGAAKNGNIRLQTIGSPTDAGYPLHLVLLGKDAQRPPQEWNRKEKVVVMINNGIHPGEPDGIDASMMLVRDYALGKYTLPDNVILGVVPVYNIGGMLNRNQFSRVNQDGPDAYGFRGNAQNLDLNRDFTKADSRDAFAFAKVFHFLDPDILIDTHVSDGADYQHTMTLITTQYEKLGGETGKFLKTVFDPALYKDMKAANWPMTPYVNVEDETPDKGWTSFCDYARYSSGYAALFQCISFMPETHMLKPYPQRVAATYAFIEVALYNASVHAKEIITARSNDRKALLTQKEFPLRWHPDPSQKHEYTFMGYEGKYKTSEVTGMQRLYYDRSAPYTKEVAITDTYVAGDFITAPAAYIIPQGWHTIIERLEANGVALEQLKEDKTTDVTAYHIDGFETIDKPFEKHYRHFNTKVSKQNIKQHFLKGDYIIATDQQTKRFLVEMLEPTGDDSYFAWNFFDAVLQQKEGYSDYRWEDVAAAYLKEHPEVKTLLEQKKASDSAFAKDASAQLNFVYKHSPYYEPAHLRYPVYRIE